MTRADLEKHMATYHYAIIGDYHVCHIPAVKGKYGIIKKAAYYNVDMGMKGDFTHNFSTLDEALAYPVEAGKTLEEMLKDVNCLKAFLD